MVFKALEGCPVIANQDKKLAEQVAAASRGKFVWPMSSFSKPTD
jgi:hypothetical protein